MPGKTNKLDEIGATLVAAGGGEPVELTDEQWTVLAAASTADVLFSIARYTPALQRVTAEPDRSHAIAKSLRTISEQLAPIATAWANACRTAFGDPSTQQRITAALATDQPLASIADCIREDDRLALYEREALLRILDDVTTSHTRGAALSETAYLSQLSVAGFRGIGPRAELNVEPHPGLTIVYGANGSGKSSFAEALDVLLTGTTGRFAGRGMEWRSAQTNVHAPRSGYVSGVFALGTHEANSEPFVRSWTDDGYLTGAYDETPTEAMQTVGWFNALDEFKPVLGYAELGPLLDEDTFYATADSRFADRRETPLAHHVRLRTGISDPLSSSIQKAVRRSGTVLGQPFLSELTAWHRLSLVRSVRANGRQMVQLPTNDGLPVILDQSRKKAFAALVPHWSSNRSRPPHPFTLRWKAFFNSLEKGEWDQRRPNRLGRYMVASLFDLCRDVAGHGFTGNRYRQLLRPGGPGRTIPGWTSRTHVYCEMLIEAIYRARLATLSQQVEAVWHKIRPGSSVQFHRIELHSVPQTDQAPVLRASLDLSLDGVHGVERGVLSQGELHSMALSVFLPTMMRPESPFGFAVIDDPVQVMDEHAVDGLAEVLRDAARDLQLIVFTHDSRLLRALNVLNAEYTRIDVARSGGSVVECKVVGDPVIDRIKNARAAADRVDDQEWQRQDVALQCRLAIEAACLRVIRARLAGQRSAERVEDTIERATQGTTTTRDLMVRAIFKSAQQARRARDKGTYSETWDDRVETTLDRTNKLVHAVFEEEARAAYDGDLHDLIDDVEHVLSVIEANRG